MGPVMCTCLVSIDSIDVCSPICLSVISLCYQGVCNSYKRILMKFFGGLGRGQRANHLDFDDYLLQDPDTEIVDCPAEILVYCPQGQLAVLPFFHWARKAFVTHVWFMTHTLRSTGVAGACCCE